MSDTSLVFNLIARDRASATLGRVREKFDMAATGIAAGMGAALGVGVAASLDMSAASAKLAAQLNLGPEQAAEMSKISADVYKGAWGESTEQVNEAIRGVYQNMGDTGQSRAALQGVSEDVLALSEAFDVDLGGATKAAGQLMKTGLAKDADEAMDLITWGFQNGMDASGDFLDTLNEYSPQFAKIGMDGPAALGLLNAMMQAGVRDSDAAADAVKEFGLRSIDTAAAVTDAYKGLGLNADQTRAAIAAGGPAGVDAMNQVFTALQKVKDPVQQNQLGTALMGTQWEDTVRSILPNLDLTKTHIEGIEGATDKMSATLATSPSKALERFKRGAIVKLADIAGVVVNFGMENQTALTPALYAFTALAGVVMVVRGAMMVYSTVSAVVSAANAIVSASTWTVIGNWTRMMGVGLMAYARIAGAAVISGATTAAAWVGSALVSIGTWIAAVVRAGLTAAAQFLMMAARAVAWAVIMAAQWLIAMGPIGWVIAAVIALVVLIIANWSKIQAATAAVWGWVWSKIQAVGRMILSFFLNWTIVGIVIKHWTAIRTGIATVTGAVLGYVRGIPGRISGVLGSLGSLLYGKGMNVVRGLWNGIKSMGGWLRGRVMSFARNMIPGPIAEALGIHSPSTVMADEVGQWIPPGIVQGAEAKQGLLTRAMASLVQVPTVAAADGMGRQLAPGSAPLMAAGGGGTQTIRIELAGPAEVRRLFRAIVRKDGGGSVQTAFGTN
ncbi:phage tail tape measure protein [Streptomyces sp. NPDC051569]|uniref:phage tail tape measure protein n=1 Tax=Streptomyces sp. NPDC051569 TaxID=3365661 RepID=UPI0037B72070